MGLVLKVSDKGGSFEFSKAAHLRGEADNLSFHMRRGCGSAPRTLGEVGRGSAR